MKQTLLKQPILHTGFINYSSCSWCHYKIAARSETEQKNVNLYLLYWRQCQEMGPGTDCDIITFKTSFICYAQLQRSRGTLDSDIFI